MALMTSQQVINSGIYLFKKYTITVFRMNMWINQYKKESWVLWARTAQKQQKSGSVIGSSDEDMGNMDGMM